MRWLMLRRWIVLQRVVPRALCVLALCGLVLGCSDASTGNGTVATDATADGVADATVLFDATSGDGTDVANLADASETFGGTDAAADPDASNNDISTGETIAADIAAPDDSAGEDSAGEDTAETDAAGDDTAAGDAASDSTDATAPASDEPVWNNAAIDDIGSANCQFSAESTAWEGTTQLKTWKLKYLSWEVNNGVKTPIWITAFAARPLSGSSFPGVVQAHGLGGSAKANDATSLAARLGVFAIAYTGPGGGSATDGNLSEGKPAGDSNGYRMFDVLTDVRGSWFWGHATAAMRGITCLTSRSEVNPAKLGITGFSAGGVTSLLVAGHDPRVVASVPLSGTLAWSVATQSPTAWQHSLLQKAGLSTASAEWQKLMSDLIAPAAALAATKASVLMVNGTTDEFFPLTAHMSTYNALPGSDKRLSLSGNFDHGCYGITGGESASTIEDRAKLHAEGGQVMWFGHYFGTDGDFSYVPQLPQMQIQSAGGGSIVSAVVDSGGGKLQVDEVRIWWSNDNAWFFASEKLDSQGSGLWGKILPMTMTPTSVVYVDVVYKNKPLGLKKFALSSLPMFGDQHLPKIRGIETCQ